jgi:hypothetical protein
MNLTALRRAEIERLEQSGQLVPGCGLCEREFYPWYRELWKPGMGGPFAPAHKPSARCRSGHHPHCTCDTCF